MDAETAALVKVIRPMVKGQIRSTQTLLRFLSKLDERLDALNTDIQEEHGGKTQIQTARVG